MLAGSGVPVLLNAKDGHAHANIHPATDDAPTSG